MSLNTKKFGYLTEIEEEIEGNVNASMHLQLVVGVVDRDAVVLGSSLVGVVGRDAVVLGSSVVGVVVARSKSIFYKLPL